MARYGNEFKERAVARLLPPESAEVSRLSQEIGVSVATLERWLADALSRPARERAWTAAARLEAVIATAAMDEAQRNAWCREKGVFPSDLQQWRESAMSALAQPEEARATPQETKQDRRRIKELEKDLRRKEKALAETTALLVLSKNVCTAPRQVFCWDMTYLPATVTGRWFFLYLILDLFSRKIVGFEVHETDDSEHAVNLLRRTALAEDLHTLDYKPVLHGDNGSTLKATTVLAMMNWLGLRASYSRPRVSDDNSFVEALFRTAKYRPQFPVKGFADLEHAREWASSFVRWYNHDHRHSGIRYVSPAQRHAGEDHAVLQARHALSALYQHARARAPRRWARHTRNWNPITVVTLNPERDAVIRAATESLHNTRSAA